MTVLPLLRDAESAAFFDAAAEGVLLLRRCTNGHWAAPAAAVCPVCRERDPGWAPAAGTGTVVSWAVPHRRVEGGGTEAQVVGVLVELEEGPWLRGPLRGDVPARTPLPVRIGFERAEAGEAVPVFHPADGAA